MTLRHLRGGVALAGTAADFVSANPVLLDRQLSLETDTGVEKIGDGTTHYASLAALPGGGGVSVANWAHFTITSTHSLTAGAPGYTVQPTELAIDAQSGTDFSVGEDPANPGAGAIFSAAGGRFQVAVFVGNYSTAVLDGGTASQRWVWFGCQVGGSVSGLPLTNTGTDLTSPVIPGDNYGASCGSSSLGISLPGETAAFNFALRLIGGAGSDSVPLDAGPQLGTIWQLS